MKSGKLGMVSRLGLSPRRLELVSYVKPKLSVASYVTSRYVSDVDLCDIIEFSKHKEINIF